MPSSATDDHNLVQVTPPVWASFSPFARQGAPQLTHGGMGGSKRGCVCAGVSTAPSTEGTLPELSWLLLGTCRCSASLRVPVVLLLTQPQLVGDLGNKGALRALPRPGSQMPEKVPVGSRPGDHSSWLVLGAGW